MNNLLSTSDVAAVLGINDSRVRQLILHKRLPATKIGGHWLISSDDLALVQQRKPGRPPKPSSWNNATRRLTVSASDVLRIEEQNNNATCLQTTER